MKSERIRVYVAGPYSSSVSQVGILENIYEGVKHCRMLLDLGFAPFCPWLDCLYVIGHGPMAVESLQESGIAWLKASQAMLLLPGWEKSKGTLREKELAELWGIPIFYSVDSLCLWREGRIQ